MPFYSVYEMRHKICIRYFFFIDKVVILTPNIILIDRWYDKTYILMILWLYITYLTEQYVKKSLIWKYDFSHTYVQHHMVTIFSEFTKPTAQFI